MVHTPRRTSARGDATCRCSRPRQPSAARRHGLRTRTPTRPASTARHRRCIRRLRHEEASPRVGRPEHLHAIVARPPTTLGTTTGAEAPEAEMFATRPRLAVAQRRRVDVSPDAAPSTVMVGSTRTLGGRLIGSRVRCRAHRGHRHHPSLSSDALILRFGGRASSSKVRRGRPGANESLPLLSLPVPPHAPREQGADEPGGQEHHGPGAFETVEAGQPKPQDGVLSEFLRTNTATMKVTATRLTNRA